MSHKTYSVHDIANYFLALIDPEVDSMDHLKLQKLCYYAQGFNLAVKNNPLFVEHIEAWPHGPVCPSLYHEFKVYGKGSIPRDPEFDPSQLDMDTRSLLDEVHAVFGQYTGWKLRNITHTEPTWRNAFERPNKTIEHDELKAFFKTQLEA